MQLYVTHRLYIVSIAMKYCEERCKQIKPEEDEKIIQISLQGNDFHDKR